MIERIYSFLVSLFYENEKPSLTRTLSVISFLVFVLGSFYLMITDKNWVHYDTFAITTGGGGLASQIANKVNNSINNSPKNEFPTK